MHENYTPYYYILSAEDFLGWHDEQGRTKVRKKERQGQIILQRSGLV